MSDSRKTLTRSKLVQALAKLFLERAGSAWTVAELCIGTGQPRKNIERALAEMLESGLIEKYHRQGYRISLTLMSKIYRSQPVVKQEEEKAIWLRKKKT